MVALDVRNLVPEHASQLIIAPYALDQAGMDVNVSAWSRKRVNMRLLDHAEVIRKFRALKVGDEVLSQTLHIPPYCWVSHQRQLCLNDEGEFAANRRLAFVSRPQSARGGEDH
jgi:hypothetical protein